MSVTFPRGFRASGVAAGMKPSGRPDLALLVTDAPCAVAGLFTTNVFAAAPVELSRRRIAGGRAHAVIVNSGQANAATGERGSRDAERVTAAAASALGVEGERVLACSTGVIGEPLHVDAIEAALPALVAGLSPDGGDAFAEAIMTTDTRPKSATAVRGDHRVGGCAKGVGMVAPDLRLATMLAFVTTDAPVGPAGLRGLAADVLEPRFEQLTVDGCSSTNDTVLLLASGTAGGEAITPGSPAWRALADGLDEVAESLVRQLAEDAEGAEHVIVVAVSGAADDRDARAVARAVADSPLVKTAVFGGDPNPGRIVQAVGAAGVPVSPTAVEVRIGGIPVVSGGVVVPHALGAARSAFAAREVELEVSLGRGPGRSRVLGVDLTHGYVKINAEYTT